MKFACAGVILAAALLLTAAQVQTELPVFTDVTEQAGIRFKHSFGDYELSNIVEGHRRRSDVLRLRRRRAAGHLLRERPLAEGRQRQPGPRSPGQALERALPQQRRRHVHGRDGEGRRGGNRLRLRQLGRGLRQRRRPRSVRPATTAPNTLYRNNGDGTFTDVSEKSGLGDGSWSLSAPWFDYNNDGAWTCTWPTTWSTTTASSGPSTPAAGYPGPLSYSGQPDHLYRNNGDGTFTDVTKEAGHDQSRGPRR